MNLSASHTALTPPEYLIVQFPGGGQRGYATALMLEWFEKETGLPTHQLFPNVIAGSVGILIAAALYLPHPTQQNAPCMSARQLVEIFPKIAATLPSGLAYLDNKNDRTPFETALRAIIGHGKLSDFLGNIFMSTHKIGEINQSSFHFSKLIHPTSGEIIYSGDPEMSIIDIALAGTALPAVYPHHNGHIDMAFADTHADALITFAKAYNSFKGAFVRIGNFRMATDPNRQLLEKGGYLRQAGTGALLQAVGEHVLSQTFNLATQLFSAPNVHNLECLINEDIHYPPKMRANITTPIQFERIQRVIAAYIEDNQEQFQSLANLAKTLADARMKENPHTTFGIPSLIQEYDLPAIPAMSPSQRQRPSPLNPTTKILCNKAACLGQEFMTAASLILLGWAHTLLPPKATHGAPPPSSTPE